MEFNEQLLNQDEKSFQPALHCPQYSMDNEAAKYFDAAMAYYLYISSQPAAPGIDFSLKRDKKLVVDPKVC